MNMTLWAGSESSLMQAEEAMEALGARMAAGGFDNQEEDDRPRLLEVDDEGLATISIKGPLVNSDSPFLEFFGVTGYPEIRDALLAAAYDPSVTQIMLDVDSGGGAVSGVADTSNLIRMVDRQVKPVYGYAENAASAAYWLVSSARSISAGATSMVGSIGVIATHKEYSEAYKKEGIGVTVIRAGKEKALANPNEKLSEKGKAQIQQAVDTNYKVFVSDVATNRNRSYNYADESMAQGKEFYGQAALDVGLVDAIRSYDATVSALKSQSIDPTGKSLENRFQMTGATGSGMNTGESPMKKALTEQQIAALAAGVTLDAETTTATPTVTSAEQVTDAQAAQTGETANTEAVVDGTLQVAADSATALLKEQLRAAQDELLTARIEKSKLDDKLAEAQAMVAPLAAIVAASVSNMSVALNGPAVSGLTAQAALAEHARLADQFKKQYKAGGVAAISVTAEEEQVAVFKPDSLMAARIRAIHGK